LSVPDIRVGIAMR